MDEDIVYSEQHKQQQSRHVRLPPVPRRADQLLDKVVSKNLVERQWVSTLTPMDTFSPPKKDFEDSMLADPHLQVYWERKKRTKNAHIKMRVAGQSSRQQRGATSEPSSSTRRRVRQEPRAGGGRHHGDASHRTASSSASPSQRGGDTSHDDDDEASSLYGTTADRTGRSSPTPNKHRRRCPIPLNEKPMEEGEMLCLKNLLCPLGDLQSAMTLDNIDLRWLREIIQAHRKPTSGDLPTSMLTLRNFDVEALACDSTHHTKHIPFHDRLINSPRSTLVLLRNGVQLYSLLQRPESYYVSPSETISSRNLKMRHELAENERLMLLESLRSQYDQMCGIVSLSRVTELLTASVEVDHDAARRIANERYARDLEKLERHAAREQRFGDLLVEQEEEATKRAMELEAKIQRQHEALEQKLKERGEALRKKAAEKQAAISQARAEQQRKTEELAVAMAQHRQHKLEAIAQMKEERLDDLHQRAASNAQRIDDSKKRLQVQEEEEAAAMRAYERTKKARAVAFQEKKQEARAELLKKAGDEDARRDHVKLKATAELEHLRDKMESKLSAAEQRFHAFRAERREQRKIQRVIQQVRELKSRDVIEQAKEDERRMVENIIIESQLASDRLKVRRRALAKEQRRGAEVHAFTMGQKQRVVAAKLQQGEFDKLLQLTHMQQSEEALRSAKAVEEEAIHLTREGDKKIRLQRRASKAQLEERVVQEGKALFQRTLTMKKSFSNSFTATGGGGDSSDGGVPVEERRSQSAFASIGGCASSSSSSSSSDDTDDGENENAKEGDEKATLSEQQQAASSSATDATRQGKRRRRRESSITLVDDESDKKKKTPKKQEAPTATAHRGTPQRSNSNNDSTHNTGPSPLLAPVARRTQHPPAPARVEVKKGKAKEEDESTSTKKVIGVKKIAMRGGGGQSEAASHEGQTKALSPPPQAEVQPPPHDDVNEQEEQMGPPNLLRDAQSSATIATTTTTGPPQAEERDAAQQPATDEAIPSDTAPAAALPREEEEEAPEIPRDGSQDDCDPLRGAPPVDPIRRATTESSSAQLSVAASSVRVNDAEPLAHSDASEVPQAGNDSATISRASVSSDDNDHGVAVAADGAHTTASEFDSRDGVKQLPTAVSSQGSASRVDASDASVGDASSGVAGVATASTGVREEEIPEGRELSSFVDVTSPSTSVRSGAAAVAAAEDQGECGSQVSRTSHPVDSTSFNECAAAVRSAAVGLRSSLSTVDEDNGVVEATDDEAVSQNTTATITTAATVVSDAAASTTPSTAAPVQQPNIQQHTHEASGGTLPPRPSSRVSIVLSDPEPPRPPSVASRQSVRSNRGAGAGDLDGGGGGGGGGTDSEYYSDSFVSEGGMESNGDETENERDV